MIDEKEAKEMLLDNAKKQLQEIRQATVDMREALKTKDEEQIKFVIATVRLVHEFLFMEAPQTAAKAVLQKKYEH